MHHSEITILHNNKASRYNCNGYADSKIVSIDSNVHVTFSLSRSAYDVIWEKAKNV